jgi:glycine cleavage system H protein
MIIVRGCEFPEDRHYHADYNVWAQRSGKDVVTLGATAFGVALAIEFFAFTPKAVGTRVEAGKAVGLLELSKTVVSVRSPIAGRIVEVNAAAVAKPSIISADPYGAGWLVRLLSYADLDVDARLLSGAALAPAFEAEMALEGFDGLSGPGNQ